LNQDKKTLKYLNPLNLFVHYQFVAKRWFRNFKQKHSKNEKHIDLKGPTSNWLSDLNPTILQANVTHQVTMQGKVQVRVYWTVACRSNQRE
jgi:hypothetical protein